MAAVDPFPSLTKSPLPHPGRATKGDKTLSFYPDRPVYWEKDGAESFALPEDAQIRSTGSKNVPEHLQGMLFAPETLKEHWKTPERKEAVKSISMVNRGYSNIEKIADDIRTSRMPTSLIREFGNSGVQIDRQMPPMVGFSTYGQYMHDTKTVHVGPYIGWDTKPSKKDYDSRSIVLHEMGHAMHDLTGRSKFNTDEPYAENNVYLSNAADPLKEGHAEGVARRYDIGHMNIRYDDPYKWNDMAHKDPAFEWEEGDEDNMNKGSFDLYTHLRDSVASSGKMHIINPELLRPLVNGNRPENYEKESKTRYPAVLDMIKSGKTDVEGEAPPEQLSLF